MIPTYSETVMRARAASTHARDTLDVEDRRRRASLLLLVHTAAETQTSATRSHVFNSPFPIEIEIDLSFEFEGGARHVQAGISRAIDRREVGGMRT